MSFDVNSVDTIVAKEVQKILSNTQVYEKKIDELDIGVFIWVLLIVCFGILFMILSCMSLSKDWPRLALTNGLSSFFLVGASAFLIAMKHGQLIYMVDFCEEILKITDRNEIPS